MADPPISPSSSAASRDLPIPAGPATVQKAAPFDQHALEHPADALELDRAADERNVEPPRPAGRPGRRRRSGSAVTTSRLPFTVSRRRAPTVTASRTNGYVVSPSRISPVSADCSRRLATTASPVTNASAWPLASEHLAGVDPDPARERQALRCRDLAGRPVDRGSHLERRADCLQRVVLVDRGDAEDGHHVVAAELDRAAVALDHDAHVRVPAREQAAHRLDVRTLAERGRADDAAEEDRDGLAGASCASPPCNGAPHEAQNRAEAGLDAPQREHVVMRRV